MVRTFLVQTSLITLCALGVTVVLATDAAAQRVIVVANTMSATQEAARLYVHSVDFQAGVLPGATPLLGTTALGTLTPAPDGRYLLVASGWPAPVSGPVSPTEPCCVNVICARPFQVVEAARRVAAPGWREWPVGTLNVSPGAAVVLLGEAKADGEEWGGKLEVVAWDEDGLFGGTLGRWELPQRPLAAVALPGAPARWVVLCQSAAATPPVLAVADLTGVQENGGPESQPSLGELTFVEVAAPADSLNISASALLPSPDGDGVLVMLSGYRAREQTRDQVTWVSHAQGPDLSMDEAPVEIPGVAANTTPFVAAGDKVWALTILPGTGHAYAARIGIAGGTPRKEEQYILSGAQQALRLAVAPEGGDVAVALDERVEVWPAGMRGDASFAFERPIAMLEWIPNGLLAAEGGRLLHLIDPSREHLGRPRASALQLQSGQAGLIAVLGAPLVDDMDNDGLFAAEEAAGGTSPDGADSDEDGIHDGIDPSPLLASPELRATPLVTLQGDAAGRELKAVSIDVGAFPDLPWVIDYDRAALPWLVIHPLAGRGAGVSYLGIDPAAYPGQSGAGGSLVVRVVESGAATMKGGRQRVVLLRVAPPRGPLRRILWLQAEAAGGRGAQAETREDPSGLHRFLSGPPHFFAHETQSGPLDAPLSPYCMVVVTAGAALEGAVTRQAVLDYVAEGGALLFLGGGAPVEAVAGPAPAADTWAALLSWLAPLDVQIRMDKPVQGTFEAPGDEVLTRHWHTFRLAAGPGIEAPAASVLVPAGEPTMGAFVVREYGYGRVALLSADSPLGDTAFAADLFEWLARANRDRRDMDGDLLPDGLEDKDNNGNLDAGETSFLNPDTDGDGIPDGLEDRNRSGGTDDSETDPRNVDSDSDGLFDGADPLPLPPLDAPRLLAAVPAVAPAEGNQAVLILGRNLTPQSRFWFGERPAAWARLFNSGHAEAWLPDAGTNEGGPVTLRVVTADGQEALLPGGFTYRARTKVVLKLISSARTEAEIGRGSLTVMLAPAAREDAPPRLSRLLLLLRSSVGAALVWEKSEATARLAEAGGTIQVRPSEAGSILMEAHPGRAGGIPYGSVFRVSWRVNWAALTEALVTVEAPIALVFTAHEGTLAVEKELLVLTPAGAAPPAPQRQVE